MENENNLARIIADNLIYYRKQNNLTQAKLADILSYSDKAVSKWERAEGVPDIFILKKLADLYHITVNDLLSTKKKRKQTSFFKNRVVITLLSIGLAWLVAIVIFAILLIINGNIDAEWHYTWLCFIYPIPVSFIIALVFSKIWGQRWQRFFIVTGINWTVGLGIYLPMALISKLNYAWGIWTICAGVEVLIILWYLLKRKKTDPDI